MNGQKGRVHATVVIVNGDPSPEFEVNNGGKQGDPLFPLIIIHNGFPCRAKSNLHWSETSLQ